MNATCTTKINLQNSSNLLLFVYLPAELALFKFVWPCIIFVGLTGNIVFIWVVKQTPSLHTSTYIFLVCLACSDIGMLVGFSLDFYPDVFYSTIRHGKINLFTAITITFIWFCFGCSLFYVTLVSMERYLAICHPIRHYLLKGLKRTGILACIIPVLSLVSSTQTLARFNLKFYPIACIVWPKDPKYSNYPETLQLSAVLSAHRDIFTKIGDTLGIIFINALLCINFFMYARILQALRRRKRDTTLGISAEMDKIIRQVSTMVIVNGLVFAVCTIIFTIDLYHYAVYSLSEIRIFSENQIMFVEDICMSVALINGSINPLIYVCVNERYRQAFKKTFCKQSRKPTTRQR